MLLPSKTDTKWFHEIILKEKAEIRWIKGRIKFIDQRTHESKDPCPYPCMIVIFDGR
jgi:site-specific DNA-methyltransferase (adenine-specific)